MTHRPWPPIWEKVEGKAVDGKVKQGEARDDYDQPGWCWVRWNDHTCEGKPWRELKLIKRLA